jgi:hypothetical protein
LQACRRPACRKLREAAGAVFHDGHHRRLHVVVVDIMMVDIVVTMIVVTVDIMMVDIVGTLMVAAGMTTIPPS